MPRRRQGSMGLGIFLLFSRIFGTGINNIPPVTLICIAVQSLLFLGYINPPWDRHEVCLSAQNVLIYNDYRTLLLSAFEHSDDFHLYHNMVSLMLKGRTLEARFGSQYFLILLMTFVGATGLMYVGLAKAAFSIFDDHSYLMQCAIGFSGVIFALKVLTTYYGSYRNELVHGIFSVPAKYAVWAELIIIHILVPRASFMGHLAGILVGLLYVNGPLKFIIDSINNIVSGFTRPSYEYYDDRPHSSGSGRSYTYDRGTTSESQTYYEETLSSEDLRRRRMDRFGY